MTPLTMLLLGLALAGADKDAKTVPAAKVTATAELACLHCTFGQGDGCAVCLKLDDKTPLLLEGDAAKPFMEQRFSKKVVVAEGTLSLNKDKRLVLTTTNVHAYGDKDKGKAPAKGLVRMTNKACCGHCDLGVCDECTLAVKNAKFPVVLDGKLAHKYETESKQDKTVTVTGKLFVDRRGLVRLDAQKVDFAK